MFAMGTLVSWPATQTSCIFAEVRLCPQHLFSCS